MGKRYKLERGLSPEALSNNVKAMWHNSPGLRLRLYAGIAVLVFGAIWVIVN